MNSIKSREQGCSAGEVSKGGGSGSSLGQKFRLDITFLNLRNFIVFINIYQYNLYQNFVNIKLSNLPCIINNIIGGIINITGYTDRQDFSINQ